ncbi:MAG: glycosyltransferase [Pirellulales bacterium]|nr:glycosyltransferase [Pirellulales bacterium]
MSHDLDIGVIYTHERELMARLLATMAGSSGGLRTRLLLVDNASADGAEQWRGFIDDTLVLYNRRRLSYAANLNRVLDAATARYVLLMNTDMYFDPRQECLRRMVEFMDGRPDCGLSGCRILHADGADARSARRFQTVPLILARRCGLGRLMRRTLDRHFYAERAPDDTFACDWLSGCFLMVRRAAIEQVGRLDEKYGKYFEDVDLCLRMARAGWKVLYHGAVGCYHLERRASRNPFSTDARLHLRAYFRWLRRWGFRPTAGGT